MRVMNVVTSSEVLVSRSCGAVLAYFEALGIVEVPTDVFNEGGQIIGTSLTR